MPWILVFFLAFEAQACPFGDPFPHRFSHYTAAETELNFSDVSYMTVGFPIASYIYARTAYIYLNMYLKQAHT